MMGRGLSRGLRRKGGVMTSTVDQRRADQGVGLPPLPESGQVVNVRGSTWAVADVRQQGLPRSPADEGAAHLTHVVGLQSLEEDRLGEELAVVWELEVGNTVAPDQGLPETITADGFDDPNTLAAFVDAVRWGAVTSADADSYQAPFRSGANVEAYQLEPLRRALHAPRTNLLLADDVGLGKTIEAGLVIQELLLRHRARSVIIVCPPSLALKWQDKMREKFGLDFVIVDSALMAQVRRSHGLAANPFRLFPRVIVSLAWLPTMRAQRLLRAVYADVRDSHTARRYAAFDVLVVDEAHHVAPSNPSAAGGRRGYAVDSQRTVAARALAERCEHRLFLSATPHNGYVESFTALLEMIDGRRFSRGALLDERALREVAVRRLKTELTEKGFQIRQLKAISFTPDDDEQERFALLDRILAESARANGRQRSGDIVAMLLKKRFLSSPWSFARTMELYEQAAGTGRLPNLDEDDEYYQEVLGSQQSDEEEGEADQPEFSALRQSRGSDPLVVTLGNWARPRDLAHFEQFRHYHETFYAQVEALSVRPFSVTSMERGLDGVLVSAVRVLDAIRTQGLSAERQAGRIEAEYDATVSLIDTLVERVKRAATEETHVDRARQRLLNRLDQWVKRRKYLASVQKSLVYEWVADENRFGPLLISPENARSISDSKDAAPFVVANSMREVQPEINLLVSPVKENLVYVEPPGTPAWHLPQPAGGPS